MASGDLTASTATICTSVASIKTAIDSLNLAAVTDRVFIIQLNLGTWAVFKVERAA
jgi:hypothetical protein